MIRLKCHYLSPRPSFPWHLPTEFQARLSDEKALSVLEHIAEGVGVRKTGRLVGVSKDTLVRYCALAGEHASALHDALVFFSRGNARSPVR